MLDKAKRQNIVIVLLVIFLLSNLYIAFLLRKATLAKAKSDDAQSSSIGFIESSDKNLNIEARKDNDSDDIILRLSYSCKMDADRKQTVAQNDIDPEISKNIKEISEKMSNSITRELDKISADEWKKLFEKVPLKKTPKTAKEF